MRAENLVGRVFGRLTVVEQRPTKDGRARWACECECGNSAEVAGALLRSGATKSCGCLRREVTGERHTTHGLSRTPEHQAWLGMKSRCYNPKNKQFKDYGGRGITVCERWRESFEAFFEDMGVKPSPELEIDREKNDLNYSCGKCEECRSQGWIANCGWVTKEKNNNNRRSNVHVTAFGETKTSAEWARDPRCRVTEGALWFRVTKSGWEPERAITEPSKEIAPPRGPIEAFGESKSLAEWARDPRCVVDYGALKLRIRKGNMDAEAAITTPAREYGPAPVATAFGETRTLADWAKDERCMVNYYTLFNRVVRDSWPAEQAITTHALPTGNSRADVGMSTVTSCDSCR